MIAAAKNQIGRDVIIVLAARVGGFLMRNRSDIFGALLSNEPGWPQCQHDEK